MNFGRRLEFLEKKLTSDPILLKMPDGHIERLRGRGDYALDLILRASRGDRTPEMALIAQSVSSVEPNGGHMLNVIRVILSGPKEAS